MRPRWGGVSEWMKRTKFVRQGNFYLCAKTVVALLQNTGVFVEIAADIMGHDKPGELPMGRIRVERH